MIPCSADYFSHNRIYRITIQGLRSDVYRTSTCSTGGCWYTGVNCQHTSSPGTLPSSVTTLSNETRTVPRQVLLQERRKSERGRERFGGKRSKEEEMSVKYGFGKLEWRSHTAGAKWLDGRGRKLFMKLSVTESKLCSQREETERRKSDRKASRRVKRRAK